MEISGGWVLPGCYLLGSLWAFFHPAPQWRIARLTAVVALIATLCAAMATPVLARFTGLVTADPVGLTGAVLVSTLGWVIINYSARYLEGEAGQAGFMRNMLATLAAVGVLIVSENILIIVLAWAGSSFSLHNLLIFYRNRQAAQVVAHKKFLVSRLAEVYLAGALALVYHTTGTFSLAGLNAFLAETESLPVGLHAAAVLFALAAILKTAQLPLHGWIIQVMEAPTPVSALLHAGIVNIGGFVLIRLGELISLASAAQVVLVAFGSMTAVLAGLVMLTRISVKVRLAWSTCAQMGLMIMEIGLGLYALAMLHLIAHSAYKAYCFLSHGEMVNVMRRQNLAPAASGGRSILRYLVAVGASALLVTGSVLGSQLWQPSFEIPFVALFILTLGLSSLIWSERGLMPVQLVRGVLSVLILTQLYIVWHLLFDQIVPMTGPAMGLLVAWVTVWFAAFYFCQAWLRLYPGGRFARAFYPWAYAGFYLDETFTRFTFRIWPIRYSPQQSRTLVNRFSSSEGELL